jgi:hypothetical protein
MEEGNAVDGKLIYQYNSWIARCQLPLAAADGNAAANAKSQGEWNGCQD